MTSSQNKVKRPDPQPAPERGFAGKSPLVSGMLAKRDQLMASAVILKLVSRAVADAHAKEQYAKKLFSLADEISDARRSEKILTMIRQTMQEVRGVPKTKREALEMALERKGIAAEIIDEKEARHFSLFKIKYRGQERSVPFQNNIMEGNAVANFQRILATSGIVGNNRELMESRKEEIGSVRPPAEPIEVDHKKLEGRKINYDGKIGSGLMQFTYYAEGINTSIGITGNLRNGELLAEIDRKIFEIHETFGAPLDAAVVEQQTSEKPCLKVPGDLEIERIVNGLHFIVSNKIPAKRMPEEYQTAIETLKASPEYHAISTAAPITKGEAGEFANAFKELDTTAHTMVRVLSPCGNEGEFTGEGEQIITQALGLGEGKASINPAAISNIATAYSMLTGQSTSGWKEDEFSQKHQGMMFTIRKKMKELTGNLIFSPVQ